jgi:hypothetical protein
MKKYLMLLSVAVLALASCTQMNDTHNKYRNEDIYSGKVSNVTGEAGIERVIIRWENPVDFKSRKIFVEYYSNEENVMTKFSDKCYDEVNNRITLDSMEISGLADDVPYIFKVYTLDVDNNKSIADSVVLQPMSLAACKAIVGPQVESTVSSVSGVDSVIISIRDLTKDVASGYHWSGDLAFEVYKDVKDASGNIVGSEIIYSEDNQGLPTMQADGKNFVNSYSFCPGKIDFEIDPENPTDPARAQFWVSIHIGMTPLVKDGISSSNVPFLDSFTWNYTFNQIVTLAE